MVLKVKQKIMFKMRQKKPLINLFWNLLRRVCLGHLNS